MAADSGDIFAGQPTAADVLAELYDLEHDEIADDLGFYAELAGRTRGAILDLGCGSGRLFGALLREGRRLVGLDGSGELLRRAARRIECDQRFAQAARAGRLQVVLGDVRRVPPIGRFSLITAVGVLPHLDGPSAVVEMLRSARQRLTRAGRLVVDDLGPVEMPLRDLPLSVDWRRTVDGDEVTRRSRLLRSDEQGGVRVVYSTLTERRRPDGTIARLPAGFRLWYPSPETLIRLAGEAGLVVELAYGSHDLDPLGPDSERRIFILRRSG
ncbi:MAG TPA: class I SAM-dependent methyltransferase [Candidatus Limnocylindria bacterium]|nr:class I SAM-dependent methyltransferase [Candidatus Limnocylindria bacterium]